MSKPADELCAKGREAEDEEDFSVAFANYDAALEHDPDHQLTWYRRGVLRARLGEYEAAVRDFDEAIRLDGDDAEAFLNRALCQAHLHRFPEALRDCHHAMTLDDADSSFQLELDWIIGEFWKNFDDGLTQEAIRTMTAVIENADKQPLDATGRALEIRAQLYFQVGLFEKALEDSSASRKMGRRDSAQNRARDAFCFAELGQDDEALESIVQAISLKQNSPSTWHALRSRLLTQLGLPEEGLEYANIALAVDPRCAASRMARGQALYALDEIDGAIADFTEAIQSASPPTSYHFLCRAVAFVAADQDAKALSDLNAAIALNDTDPYAFRLRARLHSENGRPDLAAEDNERAEALE